MSYISALKPKLIYVFRINDKQHEGLLKIGEATMDNESATDLAPNSDVLNIAARKRIDNYTKTAGITYELLYTETAIVFRKSAIETISDSDVHKVLDHSNIKRIAKRGWGDEWFKVDLETVKKAIAAAKKGQSSLNAQDISKDKSPIVLRQEQRDAIEMAKKNIANGNSEILWNAKMRFGKTLTALQLVKELKCLKTIILTHRPVVDKGWFDDFLKIFNDTNNAYVYVSKNQGESPNKISSFSRKRTPFIYFASMQDLRGSEKVGGKFDKNDDIFKIDWDLVIIDEAHEGTQTELGQSVIQELKKEETIMLHLSGTPFNIISGFKDEQVYTWDYVMEQKMKKEWDKLHFGDSNPYAMLPKLNIYTFDLGELLGGFEDDDKAFNFTEFFRVWTGVPKKDRRQMPSKAKVGDFIHETDIKKFLNLITKDSADSYFPYSNEEFRNNFRHSLWMIPGVKEAQALSKMLKAHPIFGQFEIINVAGNGDEDEENDNALKMVLEKISDNPDETRTITLSCGRLTTGVTVPAWTAVFMLAGSYNTAASTYMQTIFRVQSPATINGRVKEDCFVFDFAPDRTLKVVAEAARVSAKKAVSQSDSILMGDLLNFMPIISVSGTQMTAYSVEKMLAKLKEAYIDRVVNNGFEDSHIYDKSALESLNDIQLKDFEGLQKIIGSTKSAPKTNDIVINDQGFDNEERDKDSSPKKKRVLSPEEKAALDEIKRRRKQREAAISILRGISIRIPLLMYGAETKNDDEITIENFSTLIDDESWGEFMPKGVDKETFKKFSKYYDKDIFREAGKRIRFMARKADELPVTERIERIAQIFGTFRNPDKETVLTPWRVVNMHLGDCIGGYNFFDENFEHILETPRFVDQGKTTKDIFSNKDSKILEINSKTGLYPLYMAYSFFRTQCETVSEILGSFDKLTMEQEHKLWDKAISQNMFVVCRTPMAKSITQRTLRGFRTAKVNVCYMPNLLDEITNNQKHFLKQVSDGANFWNANKLKDMKFDAIVGNPPYQENDGSGASSDAATPVYNKFVDVARNIKPQYLTLIMPSKWMIGGRGLQKFREDFMNDKHIEVMFDFEDSSECFTNQHIDGGICYFRWNKDYDGMVDYSYKDASGQIQREKRFLKDKNTKIVIRDTRRISLINKVSKEKTFADIVSFTQPFGIRKDLFNNPEKYASVKTAEISFKDSVEIWGVKGIKGGARRTSCFIESKAVTKNREWIAKNKLLFTTSYSTNATVPPVPILAGPNVIGTETFLVIGPFETAEEMNNCNKYLRTRFFRLYLFFGKGTMQVSKEVFQFVPLQDFTAKSDIDWSKSVADIDKQLYKKYGLSPEEIGFVEGMIKEMV